MGGTLLSRPHWVLRTWGQGSGPLSPRVSTGHRASALVQPLGARTGPGWASSQVGCLGTGGGVRVRLGGPQGRVATGRPGHSYPGTELEKCLRDTGKKRGPPGFTECSARFSENREVGTPGQPITPTLNSLHCSPTPPCPVSRARSWGVAVGPDSCHSLSSLTSGQDLSFPLQAHTPWAVPQLCCHSDKK